jgi:hypothetical protein
MANEIYSIIIQSVFPGTNKKQQIRPLAMQEVTRDILPQNGECSKSST